MTERKRTSSPRHKPATAPARHAKTVRAVIETPQGSRNKLKFDHELGCFRITRSLAAGMNFPFDFGYFPATVADDGDPLDVLIVMVGPGYPGRVVDIRLFGLVEAAAAE